MLTNEVQESENGGATVMKKTGAKGQALVEFAVVVPLLMLLVLGIFEFGRIYNAKLVVTQAAREGARRAVITGTTDAQAMAAAQSFAQSLGTVTVDPPSRVVVSGDTKKAVSVSVHHNVQLVIPSIGVFFGGVSSVPVTGTAQMREE